MPPLTRNLQQRLRAICSSRYISTSTPIYSGHNRWSKIHRAKGVEDAKRSKRFSKAVTEIISAARKGGSDPTSNPLLAYALRNARSMEVPKDNITTALAKAAGPIQAEDTLVWNTYEALGPGNFPMLVETLSNNPTRTAKNVKVILKDRGGRVAPVSYAFKRVGVVRVRPADGVTYNQIWTEAIEAGATDAEPQADPEDPATINDVEVTTDPTELNLVSIALMDSPLKHTILESGLEYVAADPDLEPPVVSKEDEVLLEKLCAQMSEDPDVDAIWTLRGRYE